MRLKVTIEINGKSFEREIQLSQATTREALLGHVDATQRVEREARHLAWTVIHDAAKAELDSVKAIRNEIRLD